MLLYTMKMSLTLQLPAVSFIREVCLPNQTDSDTNGSKESTHSRHKTKPKHNAWKKHAASEEGKPKGQEYISISIE